MPVSPPIVPADLPEEAGPATPPAPVAAPASVQVEVPASRLDALPDLLLGSRWHIAEVRGAQRLGEIPAPLGTLHVLGSNGDPTGEGLTFYALGKTGFAGLVPAQAILHGL